MRPNRIARHRPQTASSRLIVQYHALFFAERIPLYHPYKSGTVRCGGFPVTLLQPSFVGAVREPPLWTRATEVYQSDEV